MSEIAWYAVCICVGLALDWAMLERIVTTLEVPLKRLPTRGYLDTLFPRIGVTVLSLTAVAYGTMLDSSPQSALFLGFTLFLLSLAYGVAQRFPRDQPGE